MNFFQRIAASAKVLAGRLEAVYKNDLDEANMYIDSLSRRLKEAEAEIVKYKIEVHQMTAQINTKIHAETEAPGIEKAPTIESKDSQSAAVPWYDDKDLKK